MDSSRVDPTTLLAMQMQSTVRWCVRDEETSEVKDCAERSVALRGSKEWTERRRRRRRRRRRKKRDPHSRRLSCSPSAYHGVRGQDLYVEFIVAESALLRFMDVFRRSAAARVIYRGTLALPPSPSHSVTELFSLSLPLSLSLLPCRVLSVLFVPSTALIRYTRVALRETEGFLMNATTESLFSSLFLSHLSFLSSISRRLSGYLSLSLFHFLSTLPPHSLSLGLVSVVSATSFAPHINARFIPQNPGRYRIYIFVASL